MTARYSFPGFVLAATLFATAPALAGWTPDGATIKATNSHIAKVSAVNDGGYGAYVVWQEESTPGTGVLRAQHVLATGDVDPAWPAEGMLLCSVVAARAELGTLSDGLGGAYVWWKEGAAIYVSRLLGDGTVATGWPVRGRSVGLTNPTTVRPSVIEDGANGLYLAWTTGSMIAIDPTSVVAIHLGPGNTGAGGWPNGARGIAGGDPIATLDWWPRIALAPDGGLFVAWARWSTDPEQVSSAYLLRRLTTAGLNAAGWDPAGLDLGVFHGELLGDSHPQTGLVGLSDDGLGGVFALIGFLSDTGYGALELATRLFRLQGDGSTSPGWPETGLSVGNNGIAQYFDVGLDASLRVFPDGLGGAQVGQPSYYDHGTSFEFAATLPEPAWKPASSAGAGLPGYEVVPNGNGGVFTASFYPKGPYGPYEPYAYLQVQQSLPAGAWSSFTEIHFDLVVTFYGDIGLAESGDGGAIFFWSQERERFGLFARRFNGTGQVTGIVDPAGVTSLSLARLKFTPGEGVRAYYAVPSGSQATLDLFDVGGRRVASTRVDAGVLDVVLPGTRALASGLYFAKLANGREAASGKVVVAR